jgi:MFS family permease
MKGFFVIIAISIAFSLFRRWAPRDEQAEAVVDNGKRLPFGAAGACMWIAAIVIAAGGFFLLYGANRLWASWDKQALLILYPPSVIWCFAPGFAAMLLPYFLVLWSLRKLDYAGQAAEIVAKGNAKINVDGERVMGWLGWIVVLPIFLFTIPAIPTHLSVESDAVRVTHYAHIAPEVFSFADARSAWFVDGYALRDGMFKSDPDLIIDFVNGRRFRATAMSDGGDPPSPQLVSDLLARISLQPNHVQTEKDIPVRQ